MQTWVPGRSHCMKTVVVGFGYIASIGRKQSMSSTSPSSIFSCNLVNNFQYQFNTLRHSMNERISVCDAHHFKTTISTYTFVCRSTFLHGLCVKDIKALLVLE